MVSVYSALKLTDPLSFLMGFPIKFKPTGKVYQINQMCGCKSYDAVNVFILF